MTIWLVRRINYYKDKTTQRYCIDCFTSETLARNFLDNIEDKPDDYTIWEVPLIGEIT